MIGSMLSPFEQEDRLQQTIVSNRANLNLIFFIDLILPYSSNKANLDLVLPNTKRKSMKLLTITVMKLWTALRE